MPGLQSLGTSKSQTKSFKDAKENGEALEKEVVAT